MATRKRSGNDVLARLRAFGLRYPEAHLRSPWPGHLDLAVRDKTFAFLSSEGEPFSISCKLPHSSVIALGLPFVEPTGYGLGKSGWVTARAEAAEACPIDVLEAWIDESYRAQAPKRLVAQLDANGPANAPASRAKPAVKARKARAAKAAPAKATRVKPRKPAPAKAKRATR